jgi:hypothetical protein
MRKFLKTAAVCFALCAGVFAQNVGVDLSTGDNPQERYEHFKKMKNVGNGLIIGGVVFGTTGIVLATVHAIKAEDYANEHAAYSSGGRYYFWTQEDADNYDKELLKSAGWIIASSLGYTVMVAGIPIRIVGRVKAAEWKSKLPTAYVVPNGVKLVWNF